MLLDLPEHQRCFVDANIFYYHFVETPPLSEPCTRLLERAAIGSVEIYSAMHVLSETVHKVMVTEAEQAFGRNRAGLVNWLQRNGHRIPELTRFRRAAAHLAAMGLRVLPTDVSDLVEASLLSAQFGLLTNDATIVALMRRHALTDLVTNDEDFDGIPDLRVWKPR
jgi:predicted nucleic acid-binding protein